MLLMEHLLMFDVVWVEYIPFPLSISSKSETLVSELKQEMRIDAADVAGTGRHHRRQD